MNWLLNSIGEAVRAENPEAWKKFGEILQSHGIQTPVVEEKVMQRENTMFKEPVKKRVFSIGVSFWLSLILVGGAYLLIEGIPYEKLTDHLVSFIENELVTEEYTEEIPDGYKLIENEALEFEIQIPAHMEAVHRAPALVMSFEESQSEGDIKNRSFFVEKIENVSQIEGDSYIDDLASSYAGYGFELIEDGVTMLNGLPARKYVYQFYDSLYQTGAIHVVLVEEGTMYKLVMYDDIDDFPQGLADFEIARESFFAW